ncbi:MAG: Eco57I restriction-modification methylase domain-containing protein [Planctomycetota bacterium]|nr:Eco57I restriction-modification methylase domain-containing protein [Planctomycetota bacterium]
MQRRDAEIREKIAGILAGGGMSGEAAHQLSAWDPYDQNDSAPFFDPEWMYGVTEGFHVVIGNPPYIDSELMKRNCPEFRDYLRKKMQTTKGNWDIYIPFIEFANSLLADTGHLSFITPNKWLSAPYGKALRIHLAGHLRAVADCSRVKVFEAGNTPVVTLLSASGINTIAVDRFNDDYTIQRSASVSRGSLSDENWGHVLSPHISLIEKVYRLPCCIADFFTVENPFTTAEAYELRDLLHEEKPSSSAASYRFVNTGTISKFGPLWGSRQTTYLKTHYERPVVSQRDLLQLMPRRNKQTQRPKIIIKGIRYFDSFVDRDAHFVAGKSTIVIFDSADRTQELEWLCAIMNSSLTIFLLRAAFSSLGIDGGINFSKDMVAAIRLPTLDIHVKHELRKLAKQCALAHEYANKARLDELMVQIDSMTFEAFGLTSAEIAVVKGQNT